MSSSGFTVALDTAGGRRAGVGHLLRSAALAERLRALKAEVVTLSNGNAHPRIARVAMRAAGLLEGRRRDQVPQVIVVDRPDTTAARLNGLRRRWPNAALVALDYYGPPVDGLAALVNLNRARERQRAGRIRMQRIGLGFAILRASFRRLRETRRRVPERVRRILVGFGGTDPQGWSAQAGRVLMQCVPSGVAVHVLTGEDRAGEKNRAWPSGAFFTRHVAVADPASLLQATDLAIIGGGTMLIEAACLGVPAVVVPRTIEERIFARQFRRAGAARVVQAENGFPAKAVRRHVSRLLGDAETRREMRKSGRKLVDGRGADRVAKLVMEVAGQRS